MSEDQADATAAAPAQNEDDRKVFAGGLPQEASEADIKEYFTTFGGVTSVNLKMDPVTGRSRGFAFIVFDDEETLTSVLEKEHAIKGKKVAVKKAASKQGKVYVGKFTEPITEEQIKEHFMQYGNVVEIQRPVDRSKNSEPKNFCFITFDKEEPAETLLKKASVNVNGQDVQIKKVAVKDAQGGMRGGFRGGRGGGGRGGQGGQGGWGGGYDQGWGGYGGGWGDYGAGGAAWGGYGGYGGGGYGGGWGGWGTGGGGKMGAGMQGQQGGGYRGGRGSGRGGRAAPY